MTEQPQHQFPRIILYLGALLLAAGSLIVWGDDLVGFATGQDILKELEEEIAAFPSATPYPTPAPTVTPVPVTPTASLPEPTEDPNQLIYSIPIRQHVLKYTVQEGDALFLIAERFGLQPDTIFWANTETLQDNVHLLHIGTELYILPVNGVYHQSDGKLTIAEIAGQYDVDPETILLSEYNQLSTGTRDYVPPNGLRIVVPGGRREYISWQAPIRTGTAGGTNPQGALHPGSCPGGYIGSGGLGNFIDPLGSISYFVTNEFALWHAGIDLAAPLGTTIYAAETGVVVFAGWHLNGYGELVILDHGSGYTTYYAHLSDRFVQCGQQVSKGQMIGLMGTTGYSTGVHLHFEVRYNDVPQNPRFYIDFSGTPFYDG